MTDINEIKLFDGYESQTFSESQTFRPTEKVSKTSTFSTCACMFVGMATAAVAITVLIVVLFNKDS